MKHTMKQSSLLLAGLLSFLLFITLFTLLQQRSCYMLTLGKISHNYEHRGGFDDYTVAEVKKPYLPITSERLLVWDADIFHEISELLYTPGTGSYAVVRPTFFPLFPLLWKALHLSAVSACIFNYLLFIMALYVLLNLLVNEQQRLYACAVSLLFPSVIFYGIPYSEAVFMLSFTIAAAGLMKNNYALYCTGMLLTALSRPATALLLGPLVLLELIYFLQHRNIRMLLSQLFMKTIPFLTGLLLVFALHKFQTGSWLAVLEAQSYWPGSLGLPKGISDWSVEGFGMNTFCIFFIGVPSLIGMLVMFTRAIRRRLPSFNCAAFGSAEYPASSYLLHLSLSYFIAVLAYAFLYKGGSIHGLSRYMMATPLFYIALFALIAQTAELSIRVKYLVYATLLTALIIFLYKVPYGGDRITFSYMGMYLSLLLTLLVLLGHDLSLRVKYAVLAVITIPCIIWHTYLFNIMLSNGWIFT